MKQLFSVLILLAIVAISYGELSEDRWKTGIRGFPVYAEKCDFSTKTIAKMKNNNNNCVAKCLANDRCTHWVYKDGECYLKGGDISMSDANEAEDASDEQICGYSQSVCPNIDICKEKVEKLKTGNLVKDWKFTNKNGNIAVYAAGCEFKDENIGNKANGNNNCIPLCKSNPRCTHFVYSDGRCFLKKGEVTLNDAYVTEETDVKKQLCGFVERSCKTLKECQDKIKKPKPNTTPKPKKTTTTEEPDGLE